MITCEVTTSNQDVSLHPQWILDGLMIVDTPLLISTNQSIMLKSGETLNVMVMDRDTYNDTNFDELSSFSIMLLNVTSEANGLSVKCRLWWEEKNITLLYNHSAVVAVTTKNKCKYKINVFLIGGIIIIMMLTLL